MQSSGNLVHVAGFLFLRMKLFFRILGPLLIVVGAVSLARYFINTKPEPRTFAMPPEVTKVDATRLKPDTFQIFLETQGTVRPRTMSNLVPEVSGRIIEISPNFREGAFFEKNEILVFLDPLNYETALVISKSNLAQANTVLKEETVRGQQAVQNWKRLGKTGTPSEMVARKPQLLEAEARLRAAEAEVKQAERDLQRTQVKAPFAGRIVEQNVDVGQFVSSNTQLGRAFSTDVMEVRFPLTNRQLSFVDLPEAYRGESSAASENAPEVLISGRIGRDAGQWSGKVVRVDSLIDEASRQLFVVAEVKDPYRRDDDRPVLPLKIGMFVDGLVEGELLENVFVLPREAVRVGGEVIVIDEENSIRRQKVEPVWSDDSKVVVPLEGAGLKSGDVVCLTPLAYPANGAKVLPTIDGVTPAVEQPAGGTFGKGGKGGKGKGGKGKGAPKGDSAVGKETSKSKSGGKS